MADEFSSEIDTSARANEKVRPQFGTRLLTNEDNVFQHNAWDNVIWNEEQEEEAKLKTLQQAAGALSLEEQQNYELKAGNYWDEFYSIHQNKFFKDRHWLFTEFPELQCQNLYATKETDSDTTNCANVSSSNVETVVKYTIESSNSNTKCATLSAHSDAKYRFLEVGCGVGNTVFPIIKTNNNQDLMVYCCDFSETGINHVKTHPNFDGTKCHAFVCDVSDPKSTFPFPESSLNIVILIFALSAIHPDKMQDVVNRLAQHLKPGGFILFRDYGRYDMAQLRFKAGRCLSANFYVRGDGTRVYFFTQDELKKLFETAGLEEVQNLVDRRLQVNRGKQLKMFRVWIQCKYRKPVTK